MKQSYLDELKKLFEIAEKTLKKAIAEKIPVNKLDYRVLIEFQKSGASDVRNLAAELLLKNFPDKYKLSYEEG